MFDIEYPMSSFRVGICKQTSLTDQLLFPNKLNKSRGLNKINDFM